MPGKIRLLLADVDGTLVTPDKKLTADAITAARELHEAGVALAVTSGRPPRGMRMLVAPLRLTCPLAGFNGGVMVAPDLSVIESRRLEGAVAEKTIALMREQGLDAWVYTDSDWFVRNEAAPHVAQESGTVQFGPQVATAFTGEQLSRAVKITGFSDDRERMAACEREARNALGGKASAGCSQSYYLDVTDAHANKGDVVATLARLLRIEARRNRHHRRHADRRADVSRRRPFHRHGQRQRRGQGAGAGGDRQQRE